MGCHALLQGIFLTQGSNPCHPWLLARQTKSFLLSPRESPVLPAPMCVADFLGEGASLAV